MLCGPSALRAVSLLPIQPGVTGDNFPALSALEGAEFVWVPADESQAAEGREQRPGQEWWF